MKKYRLVILSALLVLVSMKAGAQYDPYFSHYYDMQPVYNPATVGKQDKLNVIGAYAMTLAGFENAPKTFVVEGDIPFVALKQIHGVGVQLMSDQIGLFAHQRLNVKYALRKALGEGWLSGGLSVGILNEKWNGSKVEYGGDKDDVLSKSDIDGNGLDLCLGFFYQRKNWYAGISGQHLTAPTIELGTNNKLEVDPSFYATGGMSFQLANPLMKIEASALVQTDLTAYRADVTGRLYYTFDDKMLYAGLNYSPTNSVTLLVGGKFQGVLVGYSFEAYTNGISIKNGSHELFVGYQMDVDLGKKGKNRHQTVRTL